MPWDTRFNVVVYGKTKEKYDWNLHSLMKIAQIEGLIITYIAPSRTSLWSYITYERSTKKRNRIQVDQKSPKVPLTNQKPDLQRDAADLFWSG